MTDNEKIKMAKSEELVGTNVNDEGAVAQVAAPKSFSLPQRIVKVIPVKKKGWLDKDHEASFLYKHATNAYPVPRHENGGAYFDPLTPEEAEYLETHPGLSLSRGDLSIHKVDNNYWDRMRPIRLGKEEVKLNLADPMDYIKYKVLLLQRDAVAPSAKEARRKASYKYAIVPLDFDENKSAEDTNAVADAYLEYSKIREDRDTLADVLFLITSQRVPPAATLGWIQGEIGKKIASNPAKFVEVIRDTDRMARTLITKGLTYNAIQKDGTAYRTMGGDLMGIDLTATIAFIKNESNSDHRILIETMVKRAEGRG